jgi:hypothetical protein
MTEQTPKLHDEFYGENRNPVQTQRIWKTVGYQAHEDAQRLLQEGTITKPNPSNLLSLMSAAEENPVFVEAFARTRTQSA